MWEWALVITSIAAILIGLSSLVFSVSFFFRTFMEIRIEQEESDINSVIRALNEESLN